MNTEEIINKIKILFYGLFLYLQIDQEAVAILITLMCIDTLMGAIKAVRLGKNFSFKELLLGFILKLSFLIIPLTVALLGIQVGYDLSITINIVMIILSVSEAFSIFGNLYSAKNKVEVKKVDFISMLLISLRNSLRQMITSLLSKLSNNIKD